MAHGALGEWGDSGATTLSLLYLTAVLLAGGELACGWIGKAARMLYGFMRSR